MELWMDCGKVRATFSSEKRQLAFQSRVDIDTENAYARKTTSLLL